MPDCTFVVERSGPYVRDRQIEIRLKPPLEHPCSFRVFVNNLPLKVGDAGSFRVHGLGATGVVTISPTTTDMRKLWGSIRFEITCPDCTQSLVHVMPAGTEPQPWFRWIHINEDNVDQFPWPTPGHGFGH